MVCSDLDDTAAQLVAGAIQEAGGRALALAGDVTDPDFPQRAVTETLRVFGGLHILVNNAGGWGGLRMRTGKEEKDQKLKHTVFGVGLCRSNERMV